MIKMKKGQCLIFQNEKKQRHQRLKGRMKDFVPYLKLK